MPSSCHWKSVGIYTLYIWKSFVKNLNLLGNFRTPKKEDHLRGGIGSRGRGPSTGPSKCQIKRKSWLYCHTIAYCVLQIYFRWKYKGWQYTCTLDLLLNFLVSCIQYHLNSKNRTILKNTPRKNLMLVGFIAYQHNWCFSSPVPFGCRWSSPIHIYSEGTAVLWWTAFTI